MKTCSKCKETKNDNEFYGCNICKTCIKNKGKIYREKNKDVIKEQKKEFYKTNKNKISEYKKEWYENNKERYQQYHIDNRDKCNERSRTYHYNNKDKVNKRQKEYRRNDIPKCLYNGAKHRAKKNNIPFTITIQDITNVMPVDNICPLLQIHMQCNNGKLKYNSFTIDRINPNLGYVPGNIQVICYKANRSKSNATVNEYELITSNLELYMNNRNLIIENGGNWSVNLKSNFNSLQSKTKRDNLPTTNITIEYLHTIYPSNNTCPLTCVSMVKNKGRAKSNSHSLDRIIPNLGYVEGNSWFISNRANSIKNDLSLDEMKLLLKNWKLTNGFV